MDLVDQADFCRNNLALLVVIKLYLWDLDLWALKSINRLVFAQLIFSITFLLVVCGLIKHDALPESVLGSLLISIVNSSQYLVNRHSYDVTAIFRLDFHHHPK